MKDLFKKPISTQKHIEYHLVHKETFNKNLSTHVQYKTYVANNEIFLKQRLSLCLNINELDYTQNELLSFIYLEDRLVNYDYLNHNEFKSYFQHYGIDIPVVFGKSKSVTKVINNIPTLKLMNIFMRHGLKMKAVVLINKVLSNLQDNYLILGSLSKSSTLKWKHVYL